jgi:hypothetical protein
MNTRKFSAITGAALLAVAVLMYATAGPAEALMLLAVAAVLSSAYGLRHYARAKMLYTRPAADPQADSGHERGCSADGIPVLEPLRVVGRSASTGRPERGAAGRRSPADNDGAPESDAFASASR